MEYINPQRYKGDINIIYHVWANMKIKLKLKVISK